MNKYELLQEEAYSHGLEVIDYDFRSENIKGLYCDNVIGINRNIKTTAERNGILAEEIGHHITSYGNIICLDNVAKRKQEYQARLDGYNRAVGLLGIISAYRAGCHNRYEIANHLEVSESYLQECIDCYRNKYGVCTKVDNFVVYFIPNLGIMEKI